MKLIICRIFTDDEKKAKESVDQLVQDNDQVSNLQENSSNVDDIDIDKRVHVHSIRLCR